MTDFKLLSYADPQGRARAGLLVGPGIHDILAEWNALAHAPTAPDGMLEIFERWDACYPVLQRIADAPATRPIGTADDVTLLAPLPRPGVLYCAGANYYDHIKEMSNRDLDKSQVEPIFFIKAASCVIGPEASIRLPRDYSEKYDWEVELAAVIARPARHVSVADALGCIGGYTILNDLSARDRGWRQDWKFGMDWTRHKSFDTSAPMGPWITPADQVGDPQALRLRTDISGETMQDGTTHDMVFSVAELIASLSRQITLMPGDIVATGTCAGVGNARGRFLQAGDTISMHIDKLGCLRNRVE